MAASVADNMALSYITTLTVREKTYEHWLLGSLHLSPISSKLLVSLFKKSHLLQIFQWKCLAASHIL